MKLELLAPCGNIESFEAALNNGADAVFFGLEKFNARLRANNISLEILPEVVKKAHLHRVKVYLTVNTLIKDEEVDSFLKMIKACLIAGVDAFIMQDYGMIALVKDVYPNAEVHASTQMGVNSLEGVRALEKLGVSRVVLSRETPLESIKHIRKHSSIEIEYFVQGALCVAFSGNCYLSSLLLNKSGNRGECKQLCRLNYADEKGSKAYHLSPRDLSLYDELNNLIDAGVTSFKVEGRLRRAGYVAQTIKVYRDALDSIMEKKNLSKIKYNDDKYTLKKVFSRGEFSEQGFLYGGNENVIENRFQNHSGVPIGEVVDCERFKDMYKIILKSKHVLAQGDGLKFYHGDREMGSLGVGNVNLLGDFRYEIFSRVKAEKGFIVNLTLDNKAESEALKTVKKIPLSVKLECKIGGKLKAEVSCYDFSMMIEEDYILEKAEANPANREIISEKINKLGDTDFKISKLNIILENVFLPMTILNNFRRKIVEEVKGEILNRYEKKDVLESIDYSKLKDKFTAAESVNILVSDDVASLKNSKAIKIYSPSDYSKIEFSSLENVGLDLPLIKSREDIKKIKNLLKKLPEKTFLYVNNYYALDLIESLEDKKFKVILSPLMNIYNSYSAYYIKRNYECVEVIVSSVEAENVLGVNAKFNGDSFPVMHIYADISNKKKMKMNEGVEFKIRQIKVPAAINQVWLNMGESDSESGLMVKIKNF